MKKYISLLIIFIITIISAGVVLADEVKDEVVSVVANEEFEIMRALGLYGESITPDSIVTREEMLKIAITLSAYEPIDNSEVFFSDVSPTSELQKYIATAVSSGMINGNFDGTFLPQEPVDINATIKMLIYSLGYDVMASYKGGYPTGYLTTANSIGLNAASIVNGRAQIDYNTLALILVDAFDVALAEQTSFSENISYEKSELTILDYINIKRIRGIMAANDMSTFDMIGICGENRIRVGDVNIISDSVNSRKYLGYNVEAYVLKTGKDTPVLKFIRPYDNNALTIKAEDVKNISSILSDSYIDDYNKKHKLKPSFDIIYNGVVSDVRSNEVFTSANGNLTLIDNDDNGTYDIVAVENYVSALVDSVSAYNENLLSKYGTSYSLSSQNIVDGFLIENKYGDLLELAAIAENNVASIYYNKPLSYADKKIAKIVISDAVAYGTVDERRIGHDGNIYVTVAEKNYKISPDFVITNKTPEFKLGDTGNFFLNHNDEICGYSMDGVSRIGIKYGILIGVDTEGSLKQAMKLKIFTSQGEMKIFDTASRIEIDGETYKTEKAIDGFVNGENTQRQFVRYELNEEEQVKSIDTVEKTGDGQGVLKKIYNITEPKLKWRNGMKSFANRFNMTDNTVSFAVPVDVNDDDSYSSTVVLKEDESYFIDVYVAENPFEPVGIVFDADSISSSSMFESEMYLVEKISRTTYNDEICTKIVAYGRSGAKELYMEDDKAKLYPVSVGDVIAFSLEKSVFINEMVLIYDLSEKKFFSEKNPSAGYSAEDRIAFAKVYEKYGDYISIVCGEIDDTVKPELLENRKLSLYKMFLYDTEEEIVREASASDIIDYLSSDADTCSQILVSETAAWPRVIIIYK